MCFRLFLARGADVELENNKGEIPMQVRLFTECGIVRLMYRLICFLLWINSEFDGLFLLACTKVLNSISSMLPF